MITRLNHAVLYVRDARVHQRFYADVLGFSTVAAETAGGYVFMRAPGSDNHHDIAFFTVGSDASDSTAGRGSVGLYHLGWEVATLAELDEMRGQLEASWRAHREAGPRQTSPPGVAFDSLWLAASASAPSAGLWWTRAGGDGRRVRRRTDNINYKAAFADSTIFAKVSGLFIAKSARIFLSNSILAFLSPFMNDE